MRSADDRYVPHPPTPVAANLQALLKLAPPEYLEGQPFLNEHGEVNHLIIETTKKAQLASAA